jgi:EAL domain-containing protein (putative c-di-GMP-specific phosphodiesterase class I)
LSTNPLRNADFLTVIDTIIAQSGIDSKYLKLELTESVLIENNYALSLLYEALHERQIDLAIDDFGTGYSSLAYLNEIPVQFLKIDRCFIDAIDKHSNAKDNQDAIEIVKATISLAKSLRKQVVAEGIETEKQLAVLIAHKCDFAQGYFLSRPLLVEQAQAALNLTENENGQGISVDKAHFEQAYAERK